jgi:hypothetical protein
MSELDQSNEKSTRLRRQFACISGTVLESRGLKEIDMDSLDKVKVYRRMLEACGGMGMGTLADPLANASLHHSSQAKGGKGKQLFEVPPMQLRNTEWSTIMGRKNWFSPIPEAPRHK